MTEEYLKLKKDYLDNKDAESITAILSMFGISADNKLKSEDYFVFLGNNELKYYDLRNGGAYFVYMKESGFTTIHLGDGYKTVKIYSNDKSLVPYSKAIFININGREQIIYTDTENDNVITRSLSKSILLKPEDPTVIFQKKITNATRKIGKTITTYTDDYNITRVILNTTDMHNFYYYDCQNYDNSDLAIETVLIEKPIQEAIIGKSSKEKNLLDICTQKGIPTIAIRETNIKTKDTDELIITKKNGLIVMVIKNGDSCKVYQLESSRYDEINIDDISSIKDALKTSDGDLLVSDSFMHELEKVRLAFIKNSLTKNGLDDEIDKFFKKEDTDDFDYIAFDLYYNAQEINTAIDNIVYTNNVSQILELK